MHPGHQWELVQSKTLETHTNRCTEHFHLSQYTTPANGDTGKASRRDGAKMLWRTDKEQRKLKRKDTIPYS